MRELWDRIGISASLLCVAHCLFTPLMVLSIPVAGEFLSHDLVHLIVALVVVPVAVWALWNGYRLHKYARVLWLGGVGIVILVTGMVAGRHDREVEVAAMVVAGLILASAHYFNLRACRLRH